MSLHNLFRIISIIFVISACGGEERAITVDLPTQSPIEETQPTQTAVPTDTPQPVNTPEPQATDVPPTPLPTETAVPTDTPEPTNTPEPQDVTVEEINEEELLDLLLAIGDMPTGWAGKAPTFELQTPGGTYTFACVELEARGIARAGVEYEQSGFGPFISETIVVYPAKDAAQSAIQDTVAASSECAEWTDADGNAWRVSSLSFPSFGDETFAVRYTGAGELDAIYIRFENRLIAINHFALGGIDTQITEEITRLAVDKYRGK